MKLKRPTISAIVLLFSLAMGLQAQKSGRWASARARGLKGPVHFVKTTCSDRDRGHATTQKFEFARDGLLLTIWSPQQIAWDCILTIPETRKGTKRNAHGDVEEVSYFLEGDLTRKNRGEYKYDDVGNWTKLVTSEMFTYTWDGGPPEGTWRVQDVCVREIQYYR